MMLGIELQETRVYQEAKAEGEAKGLERGRAEGEQALVLKLLTRKLGKIDDRIRLQVSNLPSNRVESLGEALLDFTQMDDLVSWLEKNK